MYITGSTSVKQFSKRNQGLIFLLNSNNLGVHAS